MPEAYYGQYFLEALYYFSAIPVTIGVIIAAVTLYKHWRVAQIQNFFYLHNLLSRQEYAAARRKMREYGKSPRFRKDKTFPKSLKESADLVCASYDQAGILIEAGLLSSRDRRKFYESSWGQSIVEQFEWLRLYLNEPGKDRIEFFRHFVALSGKVRDANDGEPTSRVRKVIKRAEDLFGRTKRR